MDPLKLTERPKDRNNLAQNDQTETTRNICTIIMPIVSQREINYNFMAKNRDQFSFPISVSHIH